MFDYCRLTGGRSLGNIRGIGPLGIFDPCNGSVVLFVKVISILIGVLTAAGALWFVFQIFMGAVNWISSGNDKQHLDNAKKRITNAIIGLLVVVASYSLIAVVGAFLGIDIINFELLIRNLRVTP